MSRLTSQPALLFVVLAFTQPAIAQGEALRMTFSGRTAIPALIGGFPVNSEARLSGEFVYDPNSGGTNLDVDIRSYAQEIENGLTLRVSNMEFTASSYVVAIVDRDPTESVVIQGTLVRTGVPAGSAPPEIDVEITLATYDKESLSSTRLLELFKLLQFIEEANFTGFRIDQPASTQPQPSVSGNISEFAPSVTGKPSVFLTPSRGVEFGAVPSSATATRPLLVRNFGDADLLLTQDAPTDAFRVEPDLFNDFAIIPGGEELVLDVTFLPDALTDFEETLIYSTNDPEVSEIVLPLRGRGAPLNDSVPTAMLLDLTSVNPARVTGSLDMATVFEDFPLGVWYEIPTLGIPSPLLNAVISDDSRFGLQVHRDNEDVRGKFLPVSTTVAAPPNGEIPNLAAIGWEAERNLTYYVLVHGLEPGTVGDFQLSVESLTAPPGGNQLAGDCNQDGALDIGDPVCLLRFLFFGSPAALPCGDGTNTDIANLRVFDCNGDGTTELSDSICILSFLFQGAPPPVLGRECVPVRDCPENCSP